MGTVNNMLPTFDEYLAQPQAETDAAQPTEPGAQKQLPTFDEFINQPQEVKSTSYFWPTAEDAAARGAAQHQYLMQNINSVGRILSATGHAMGEAFGDEQLGLSPENRKSLAEYGVLPDYEKGQTGILQSINEAWMAPAAAAIDATVRAGSAVIGGVAGGVRQTGEEIGSPGLGKLGAELTEFVGQGAPGLNLPAIAAPRLPKVIADGNRAKVFDGEAQYFGLKEPTPAQEAARVPEPAPEPVAPVPTVHDVARKVAPEVFHEYDNLQAQQYSLRESIRNPEEAFGKDIDARIAELEKERETLSAAPTELEGEELHKTVTENIQKGTELDARIKELKEGREEAIKSAVADARDQLLKADYRLRDLAPDVSNAYREADKRINEGNLPTTEPAQEAQPQAEQPSAPEQPPGPSAAEVQEHLDHITKDVSSQLQTAGRSAEEADAAAQLVAAHYQARSERFGGKLGSAKEMYDRDGAVVKAGKGKSVKRPAKIRPATEDAKATITLMKTADASSFIHETGHHWLDEMMKDAVHEHAPEGLKQDVKAVKDWLGVKEGEEIATRQHEKFARGFERYLMEGTAPSKGLAAVFAKFKAWLTSIYQTVDKLKSPITDDIRDVFNRLLSTSGEAVVAPEREALKEEAPTVPQGAPSTVTDAAKEGVNERPEVKPEEPAKKTDVPSGPSEPMRKAESTLVDKAGNIRIDNLNTPEDVSEVLRQTAKENSDFMPARRNVISDGQVLDLADALGMDASTLNRRKLGEAFNAEQIVAARKLLIQSAMDVRDAMAKAASGTDEDVIKYAEMKTRHQMIQEQVAGITAEAGRALRAFHELEGGGEAKAVGEFLKTSTGKDLFQLKEEAKLGASLDTAQKISKFINDSKRQTLRNQILEYYINALISGPVTHTRYSVGNALNALWTPLVEIPTAAGISALRGKHDGVYLGESGAQLRALTEGMRQGWKAGAEAWKTGVSPALPGESLSKSVVEQIASGTGHAIPGVLGKAINVPSKSVAAIHSFFKSLRYEQNIHGLSYRAAMDEGLTPGTAEFTNRVADLTTSPTEAMMDSATADSLRELYMSPTDYHSAMGKLNQAVNSNLLAKIIVPFMKIGSQITRNAFVERTPLGLLSKDVRENAFYTKGAAAGDMQLAKMTTGVALIGTMSLLTAEGLATGDGPTDPSKRAIWLLNHRPNSITIGGINIKYQGLGHLGMLMRFAANMTETAQGWKHEEGEKLAIAFMEGITRSVLDENFMRGMKDMLDAVYHPEEYGPRYVQSMATNWLPFSVGLSQVARLIDPDMREVHGIFDAATAKIPLLSETLQPRRDRFGEPIPTSGMLPQYQHDPVVQRMEALNIGVGRIERKIRGVELDAKQYDDYTKLAGRLTKMRLNAVVAVPGFDRVPEGKQIEVIHKLIESSRETARKYVMMQHPDIIQKANQAKIDALTGKLTSQTQH